MGESRTKNVLVNTGTGIAVKFLRMFLNFVLKTVFIKVLGIQYTGVSSLFTDILTILSFAELGIGSAITYALYKPVAENDQRKISQLMNFYKQAYRLVAAVVLIFGVLLIPFLDVLVKDTPDIKENMTLIYFLYLVNTACSYLLIYKSAILEARQKKYVISKMEGMMTFVRLVAECVILIVFEQFLLYLVLEILLTVIQNLMIAKEADKEYDCKYPTEKLSKDEKQSLFDDIGALAMYQISWVVLSGTDSVVISAFLGTSMVGFLSYYKMIITQITSFLQQFFTSANASVGNLAVEGNEKRQYRLFCDINFAVFWLMAFCCSSLYILFNLFVEIWLGKEYVLGESIVLALVLDFFVANMIRCIALFRTSNGLFVQGKYRPVIMAVLNILLSIILVYKMGVFGVLIATVLSRLVTQTWYDPWLVYRNVFKRSVMDYYKKYLLFVLTIGFSIFVVRFIAGIVVIQNIYLMFAFECLLCLCIPNIMVILFWHKTEEYGTCKERLISIVKMIVCRRAENG